MRCEMLYKHFIPLMRVWPVDLMQESYGQVQFMCSRVKVKYIYLEMFGMKSSASKPNHVTRVHIPVI